MDRTEYKRIVFDCLENALTLKGTSLRGASEELGHEAGWLWNRKRYRFDIGELLEVLAAFEIDRATFFETVSSEILKQQLDDAVEQMFTKA